MNIIDDIFKKHTPDFKKLKKYGFRIKDFKYVFEKFFKNNEFKAIVEITFDGKISGKIFETETNDEFLPIKVEAQQGVFVGEIRKEYEKILLDIREKCFIKQFFLFNQANRIANLIIEKYGDTPDFMWDKFVGYGVFKNPDSNKWYGIIMNIDYSKLGLNNKKPVEILNIKLNQEKIQELLKKDGFYPAWHMNKKTWITIALDETLNDKTIMKLIKESYSYTVKI